jgi:hypothetical protein
MNQIQAHSFHIPVLGIGYSIDTPVKVAHLGISSVISLLDDMLMEKIREFYSVKFDLPYQAITEKIEDFRAKRITAYLDMVDGLVKSKMEELKASFHQKTGEFSKYLEMLPDSASLKQRFEELKKNFNASEIGEWISQNIPQGSIDVNIMTKLDKENFREDEKLPVEFNDAHAALRGFANSTLNSSVVLSAGMNPRLYSYFEQFPDFFPDENGVMKKKITLKVSDFRSAQIQGKFLAKKGLWISEYRVESGLNCGGHAFATNGFLLGPILEEFRENRRELVETMHSLYTAALKEKNLPCPAGPMQVKLSAQGGVGTAGEHEFLLNHYGVDSVGWGTPFLLVPEAVNVDEETLALLSNAKEDDLYLSNISPLGIPFNNLKGNTKDIEKEGFIDQGTPGSVCTKRYASLNSEFGGKTLCTASRKYQFLKGKAIGTAVSDPEEVKKEMEAVTDKSCICVGLGTSALLVNDLDTKIEKKGVSVCPGPNMAYFSKVVSLHEMADHIYGRTDLVTRTDRPNMFVKELMLYIDYLKNKISESPGPVPEKQKEYLAGFKANLQKGIEYYKTLFAEKRKEYFGKGANPLKELTAQEKVLETIHIG